MINIICLKWGDKFSARYVNNLYYGVKQNTTIPFSFYCFTDDKKGIDREINTFPILCNNIEGWWNKLWLFSYELPFFEGDDIFYLDLDTLIIGNIDEFLQQDNSDLIVLRDLYFGRVKSIKENYVGSGLMAWQHGKFSHLWENFANSPDQVIKSIGFGGDQKYIQRQVKNRKYWQDLLPGKAVSFKVSCIGGPPKDARIVCYHGKPSIVESFSKSNSVHGKVIKPQYWVKDYWE